MQLLVEGDDGGGNPELVQFHQSTLPVLNVCVGILDVIVAMEWKVNADTAGCSLFYGIIRFAAPSNLLFITEQTSDFLCCITFR
jgi:hypothetical protein